MAEGLPLSHQEVAILLDPFDLMAPHAFAYDTFVQHIAKLTGWPVVEVTVSWTLHLDFSIAKARAVLGYNPRRDIFKMLDDGWSIAQQATPR